MLLKLKYIIYPVWRVWFYLLMILVILLMFPLLLIATSGNRFYNIYFFLARTWGKAVLYGMGFYPSIEIEEPIDKKKSYMLIANHTSMTDIMLMLTVVKSPFVFVGKKELARFPVFGFFYKKTSIMVDRNSAKSGQRAFKEAHQRLKQGVSICIFPEGAVPGDSVFLDRFKDGAFRLAIEHQIPVVPITFADNKKRFPYDGFFSGSPGKMRVKIHRFIPTASLTRNDIRHLKEASRTIIHNQLLAFQKKK